MVISMTKPGSTTVPVSVPEISLPTNPPSTAMKRAAVTQPASLRPQNVLVNAPEAVTHSTRTAIVGPRRVAARQALREATARWICAPMPIVASMVLAPPATSGEPFHHPNIGASAKERGREKSATRIRASSWVSIVPQREHVWL